MALQDSFEDASESTPRPESQSDRSRSRSLLSKRESSTSSTDDSRADSPIPEVPAIPTTNGKGKDADDTPAAKSPLLTSHRISVTSDMDDVSLEGGGYTYLFDSDIAKLRGKSVAASCGDLPAPP